MRIIATIGLALVAAATYAQLDPNRTVLVLNGEEIKGGEYYSRMEYLPGVGKVLDDGHLVLYPPGFLTILQLINEHLLLQIAKKKGLMPTDAEVQDAIKEAMVDNPNVEKDWLNSGKTQAEFMSAFTLQVVQFKVQTQGITVSDQEVADFYHKNQIPNLTVIPRRAQLRLIAVRDQSKEQAVDSQLSAGKSFTDVATSQSEDVTQSSGGELGLVAIESLPRPTVQAIDSTKIGQVTNWVDQADGKGNVVAHIKYLIEDKAAEKPIPYDDSLKNKIRHKLMLDRGVVKNASIFKELDDMRKTSQIDIKDKDFAALYEQFMQRYFHETVKAGG